ncbi:C3a anaphylatoxin chemotactic receptor-like [Scleropages formosus]|uniref:C3a anaphylatoxin chemotactic receptor-like n=1 Tax=Scleropages formosus TaxID=113540 RepID=UPI000878219C|nr:C3a anaphylatoxin chemotactic receptor-like [Scleropages formosus]
MTLNSTVELKGSENITEVTNSTLKQHQVTWTQFSLTLFTCVVGCLSNGTVIWVLGFRMKKGGFFTYVLNLAVADFAFCAMYATEIPIFLDQSNYPYGVWGCRLDTYFTRLFVYASTILIACICFERCLAIRYPMWYKYRRPQWVPAVTCIAAWVFAATILIVYPASLIITTRPGSPRKCRIRSETALLFIAFSELTTIFLLPLCVIITCHGIIIHRMVREDRNGARRSKVNLTVCATTTLFLLCWTPFQGATCLSIVNILFFKKNESLNAIYLSISSYSSVLVYLNSCLNPFVYLLLGRDMKKRIIVSLPCLQGVLERAFTVSSSDV